MGWEEAPEGSGIRNEREINTSINGPVALEMAWRSDGCARVAEEGFELP